MEIKSNQIESPEKYLGHIRKTNVTFPNEEPLSTMVSLKEN